MIEIVLCFLATLVWLGPAHAADRCPVAANEVVAGLQRRYDSTESWQADFRQETTFAALDKREERQGIVYFKKPGRMRWEYLGEEQRLIVADGAAVWLYEPAERQVVKLRLESAFASAAPYALLAGVARIDRDFEVELDEDSCTAARVKLSLKPRDDEGGEGVVLTVDRGSFDVVGIESKDVTGNVTRISFEHIDTQAALAPSLFEFRPPPGVDVVVPPGS